MDKHDLHPGQEYGYRAKARAWERHEDRPLRAVLVESLPAGKHRVRLDDGTEIEVRSSQLVVHWDPGKVDALLRDEQRRRAFSAETRRDSHLADAVTLVLVTVSSEAYAHSDRAWIPAGDADLVRDAAELQDTLLDLSPVAYIDQDDDSVCLPLPVAGEVARRIAERNPEAVAAAVQTSLDGLQAQGYLSIAPKHYKPGWDRALEWAGLPPVTLPEPEARPDDAYKRLWEALRGRGVAKAGDEEHAWSLPEAMLVNLGHLLAGAARYSGVLTLRPLPDGHVRLALDPDRRARPLSPNEIRDLALSLSRQQQAALGALRDAGSAGTALADLRAERRTVDSLLARDLVEMDVDDELRVRLTDAGWRVLAHLGPRSV